MDGWSRFSSPFLVSMAPSRLPESCCRAKSRNVVVAPHAAALLPQYDDCAEISSDSGKLKCTWASIPPGTTNLPEASMVCLASTSMAPGAARKATRPCLTPTSIRATEVEDTTSPFVISKSSMALLLLRWLARGASGSRAPVVGVGQDPPVEQEQHRLEV